MLNRTLHEFLSKHHVDYTVIPHPPAYTAQEIAQAAHIPGRDLAKTTIVKIDGKMAMLVGPAYRRFNLRALKAMTGAKTIELATEYEFQDRFGDCEVGAMPPFGNIYNMDVYVDDELMLDEEIAFNAGNHTELVKMRFKDWSTLVAPKVLSFH